jgi:hypothetical protein
MGIGINPKIFYNRGEHVHLYTFDADYLVEEELLFGLVNATFNINIFKQNGEATRKSLRLILKLVATSQIAHIGVN